MKRDSYRDAIAWIAENDNFHARDTAPGSVLDLATITRSPMVAFACTLFGVTEDEIAAEVLLVRTKAKAEQLRAARGTKP